MNPLRHEETPPPASINDVVYTVVRNVVCAQAGAANSLIYTRLERLAEKVCADLKLELPFAAVPRGQGVTMLIHEIARRVGNKLERGVFELFTEDGLVQHIERRAVAAVDAYEAAKRAAPEGGAA